MNSQCRRPSTGGYDLSEGYKALMLLCQEEARIRVAQALASNDLCDIVRLIGEATMLESLGRRLHFGVKLTEQDMAGIARLMGTPAPGAVTANAESSITRDESRHSAGP
jgi:hypothetical protein